MERVRAVLLRDTGACISPFNAFLLLQGLETLSLRVERHVANAVKIADRLSRHPKIRKVNHPSLPGHPDHALYDRYFPGGAGSIFTVELEGGSEAARRFIDSLEIFSLLANVADVKSLVIHPASTTHSQLNPTELAVQHIYPGTVRSRTGSRKSINSGFMASSIGRPRTSVCIGSDPQSAGSDLFCGDGS